MAQTPYDSDDLLRYELLLTRTVYVFHLFLAHDQALDSCAFEGEAPEDEVVDDDSQGEGICLEGV